MSEGNAILPKPEVRGVGHVTYRCAACGELIPEGARFDPPLTLAGLTAATRTYHKEHLPHGR